MFDLVKAVPEEWPAAAQTHPEVKTAFDVFGSELSDEVFAGVFDQPRQRDWREVDL
jgi:hypothetical protein